MNDCAYAYRYSYCITYILRCQVSAMRKMQFSICRNNNKNHIHNSNINIIELVLITVQYL